MASLAALNSRCVAPVARSHRARAVAPKAALRPVFSSFNGSQKLAPLAPQIQPLGVKGLRSPLRRTPLSVNAAAAGGAAAPPAKFKWGADMKNLVSFGGVGPVGCQFVSRWLEKKQNCLCV